MRTPKPEETLARDTIGLDLTAAGDRAGRHVVGPPASRERAGGDGRRFGAEVRDAMDRRTEHLAGEGLVRRQGQRVNFARDLIDTLRKRELNDAAGKIAVETRLVHRPRRKVRPSREFTGSGSS